MFCTYEITEWESADATVHVFFCFVCRDLKLR